MSSRGSLSKCVQPRVSPGAAALRFAALSPEVAGGGSHAGRKSSEVAGVGDEVKDRTVDVAHRNGRIAGASAAVAT